jgi:hypothetical protein
VERKLGGSMDLDCPCELQSQGITDFRTENDTTLCKYIARLFREDIDPRRFEAEDIKGLSGALELRQSTIRGRPGFD